MSNQPDRRTFLKQSAAAATALAAGCGPAGDGAPGDSAGDVESGDSTRSALPPDSLAALAEIVLPAELGPDGVARVTAEFQTWLDEYAPVAEQVHGYGSQEIRYTPPHPGPRWLAQLEALELEAHAKYAAPLAEVDLAARRALIETAIGDEPGRLGGQPAALQARHVAVGLLAYFFGTPEATNLCYGRRIDPMSCRPLAGSGEPPELLVAPDPGAATSSAEPTSHVVSRPRVHPQQRWGVIERGLEPGS